MSRRRLAETPQPGLTQLDAGCGMGAIRRHAGEKEAPQGFMVGMDSNSRLIQEARKRQHWDAAYLRLAVADLVHLA